MSLDLIHDKGVPLEKQSFTWDELVPQPYSKIDVDAFTRIRVLLMGAVENEAAAFNHLCSRFNQKLELPLGRIRRVEHHQRTLINWLRPPDETTLETTLALEQLAVEVCASVAQREPDHYFAQVYRFGLLENLDHLYRFAALIDRLYGKNANIVLQSYTDILPGRPTYLQHRAPEDDLRLCYDRRDASPVTKLNALTQLSVQQQIRDYYLAVGPMFADPVARQLFAEIASVEEEHISQYESITDGSETWLERSLLHEANEVCNYFACVEQETNGHIRVIWERFLAYELGHLQTMIALFKRVEGRDPAEILPAKLPEPIQFSGHREFIRRVLNKELTMRAVGPAIVDSRAKSESAATLAYRSHVNSRGSPSEVVGGGYVWTPGGELADRSKELTEERGAN